MTYPRLHDVFRARQILRGRIRRTPLAPSPSLSSRIDAPVHLKLEHLQVTGSFKVRGATVAIANLGADQRSRGVVGVSTGNHGRGLAHAAEEAGVRCVICMSRLVPRNKVDAIRALGAEVRIVGRSQDEAEVEARRLAREDGLAMLPPFDHPDVIAGQGTLGLEIVEDLPDVTTVLVPLSGGGLIAGTALALKTANPQVRVIGITMGRGAAMYESQQAGRPVAVEEVASLADSLGGGIGEDNRYTFAMVRDLVDDMLLVDEARIAEGVRQAYREEHQVIEGGGAVGLTALLDDMVDRPGATAVVLSGGNIDIDLHRRLINGEAVDLEAEAAETIAGSA
jgi:threonine dehydratase